MSNERKSVPFVSVSYADLEAARKTIIAAMVADMPDDRRRFLVGFKRGEPDWALPGIPEAHHFATPRPRRSNCRHGP